MFGIMDGAGNFQLNGLDSGQRLKDQHLLSSHLGLECPLAFALKGLAWFSFGYGRSGLAWLRSICVAAFSDLAFAGVSRSSLDTFFLIISFRRFFRPPRKLCKREILGLGRMR